MGFSEVAACSGVVTEIDTPEGISAFCTVELCFFFRNSALLRAFLLFVEGLTFFLVRASGETAEGEGGVGIDLEGEVEGLAGADQCLAESQALRCQEGIFST